MKRDVAVCCFYGYIVTYILIFVNSLTTQYIAFLVDIFLLYANILRFTL